ncbi:hypothetical protein BH11MYX1_BH11MYX1_00360 [soil metagenome]
MHKFLLVVAIAGGCSDPGSGASGPPVPLSDFAVKFSSSTCGKAFECCTTAEITAQYGTQITTEANCDTQISGLLSGFQVPAYQASITAGRLEYDAAAAGNCLALIDSLSCADYSNKMMMASVPGCSDFLIPKVANGGACAQSYECTSDNCMGANSSPPTDGSCMPVPAIGQACEFKCASGAYCKGTTCAAAKADGETCNDNTQCASDHCDTTCMPAVATCDGL